MLMEFFSTGEIIQDCIFVTLSNTPQKTFYTKYTFMKMSESIT